MPFSRRQRRTLRRMADHWADGVRLVIRTAPLLEGEPPELTAIREWVRETPAVSLAVEPDADRAAEAAPEVHLFRDGDAEPWVVLSGWPRGYEFVTLVQSAWILSAEVPPGRRASGPEVTVYMGPTCPHSPIQAREILRALIGLKRHGPLALRDVTQVPACVDPPVSEVPLTVIAGPEGPLRASGLMPRGDLLPMLSAGHLAAGKT